MRTLGDRVGGYPQVSAQRARERAEQAVLDVIARMDLVDLAQHARDRREEREAIELGQIDLGGGDA